jgi:hypothetical protein
MSKIVKEENVINKFCKTALDDLINETGDRYTKLDLSNIVLDDKGKALEGTLKLNEQLNTKGIYILECDAGDFVYVGQGGNSRNPPAQPTKINDRILQELRLYKETPQGSNGGTISKNIQDIDGISFDDAKKWREHISTFKIRILHNDEWSVSLNLVEAYIIQIFDPKYNKNK